MLSLLRSLKTESCALAFCTWTLLVGATALAQPATETNPGPGFPEAAVPEGPVNEIVTGTLKEVVSKGRSRTLIVTDEAGKDQEFMLTPKINFEVKADGDSEFVVAGQYVEGAGVLTNEQLFVSELTVYLLGTGKRPPVGKIVKAPERAGASQNSYLFGATIVSRETDKDYPEYERLTLKISGRTPPIMLEKDYRVNIISKVPEHAQGGLPIELEFTPLRGRKILVRATVLPPEPFKAADLLESADKSNKTKSE